MRLQQYLTEAKVAKSKFYTKFPDAKKYDPEFYEWYTNMYKDCKKFVDFLSSLPKGRFLWRGMKGADIKGIKTPRPDRRPKDTGLALHLELDKQMEDRYGWKPRSEGVFAGSSMSLTGQYGDPYTIFPTGKFEYLWSPMVNDSYIYFSDGNIMSYFYIKYNVKTLEELYLKLYGPEGEINNKGYWYIYNIEKAETITTEKKDKDKAVKELLSKVSKGSSGYMTCDVMWKSASFNLGDGADGRWRMKEQLEDGMKDPKNKEYDEIREYMMGEILDKKIKYREDGLDKALDGNVEIIVKCPSYHYMKFEKNNEFHNNTIWLEWLIWGDK